jgi:GxxExxY protein
LEEVHENALAHRLRKAGLDVKQQRPIKVYNEDGTLIGDHLADLLVEGELVVELKAARVCDRIVLASESRPKVSAFLSSRRDTPLGIFIA